MVCLRLFIAVPSAPELRGDIEEIKEELRGSGADVKWVEGENLHFTLKFLGEVPKSQIPEISCALSRVSSLLHPFSIRFLGVGCFPNAGNMRVVWLGIENDSDLLSLQKQVEEAMEALGFAREKNSFRAHLTLGRVRTARGKDLLRKTIEKIRDVEAGRMEVSSFTLMKSHLTSKGPSYSVVEEYRLGHERIGGCGDGQTKST